MLEFEPMSRNVGRAEIAQKIADDLGLIRSQTPYKLVSLLIDHMKDVIFEFGKLTLHRFGEFYLLKKKPRKGRNPRTGEPITIPGRSVLKFRPSPLLKGLFEI